MLWDCLLEIVEDHGLTLRACTGYHWQIMTSKGHPLVNVWPTNSKYGKALEMHKYTPKIPMKAGEGPEEDAVSFAVTLSKSLPGEQA